MPYPSMLMTCKSPPKYRAWARLMGNVVLDAGRNEGKLHLYSQCLRGTFVALQEIGNLGTKGTMHCAHPWQHRIW